MGTATGMAPMSVAIETTYPAAATAAGAETIVGRAPFTGVVSLAAVIPADDVTGVDTDTRLLTLYTRGQDGAGTTAVATLQFDDGVDGTKFDQLAMTLSATAANLNVVAGDVLTLASTKVGDGLADPGGLAVVEFSRD